MSRSISLRLLLLTGGGLVINLPQNYERGNQSTMGAMPQEPYKQNPRQNGLPEVLFFHGR
jgi:hypothetical protein